MHSACFRHTCLVRRTNDQAAVSSFNMLPKAKRPSLPLLPLGHALRRRLVGTLSSKRLPLMADQRHEACESPRDATFSFSRRVGFLSYRAFDLQPMPGRYARAELPAGKTTQHGMHATLFRKPLPTLKCALTTARLFSRTEADAGRPWAPAVAQEAQGRFRLTPLCEFSPLCYGYRTPPL